MMDNMIVLSIDLIVHVQLENNLFERTKLQRNGIKNNDITK